MNTEAKHLQRILLGFFVLMWLGRGFTREVQILPPEVKVNPLDGMVVQETKTPVSFEQFALPADSVVVLTAFPGEWKMVQLVCRNGQFRHLEVSGNAPPELHLFSVGMVQVKNKKTKEIKNLPDILIPLLRRGTRYQFPEDSLLFPEQARWRILWLEVPTGTSWAGKNFRWKMRFSGSGKVDSLTLVLNLKQTPLPPASCEMDLNEYGDRYLRVFGKKLPLKKKIAEERKIFRMIHRHGGVLNPLPYKSQRGRTHKHMAPRLVNPDPQHLLLDWETFDARYGDYFTGRAFEDGKPLSHFYLPFNPDWPAPFTDYLNHRARYEQMWEAVAREYIRHFKEKGWTQTVFQVYCNQKPSSKNKIPWNLDEPKGVEDYRALRYYCDLTHRVFADAPPVQVRFRIDISHFYCEKHRGSRRKDFRINGGDRILQPVDIWVISHHSLKDSFARRKARELASRGKMVYEYGNTPQISQSGGRNKQSIYRVWWNGWRGFLAWRSFVYDTKVGNGKNFLLYAIRFSGRAGIFPSLRFKLLKRALDDTRILNLAMAQNFISRPQLQSYFQGWEEGAPSVAELLEQLYKNLP